MAGRVDQIDVHVVDRERRHRRLDRDPAQPLEGERVRLRRPRVDAAEVADDACLVEQAFGESCLTGVYMRQDSEVELLLRHASFPPGRSNGPVGREWMRALLLLESLARAVLRSIIGARAGPGQPRAVRLFDPTSEGP